MPKYIIMDTEGTGLFQHNKTLANGTVVTKRSDEPGQPRMAEFAAALVDEDFNVYSKFQQHILPVGWQNEDGSPVLEMPEGAYNANGLTMDFLRAHGRPVAAALDFYTDAILSGHIVIGFNQQHDGRQVRAELRHAGRDDLFERTPNICAMLSLRAAKIKIPKLNGKGGMPRLIDAAAHFGAPGYTEDKHHQALEDVMATVHVARCLHQQNLLLPAEVHYAKNYQGERT